MDDQFEKIVGGGQFDTEKFGQLMEAREAKPVNEKPEPKTNLGIELKALRERALGGDDETNIKASKFDALFLLQAQIKDETDPKEKKQLETFLDPLTNLVTGHEKDVSLADKKALLAYIEEKRAAWTFLANNGEPNLEAQQNDIIYLDIQADLQAAVDGTSKKYDNMPPIRPYEYAPQKAKEAAVALNGDTNFTKLPSFIDAVGADLESQRGIYKGDSHTSKTLGAIDTYYRAHKDQYEKKQRVTITFNKQNEPIVAPETTDSPNPDGITYTFDPATDMDIVKESNAFDDREKQIKDAKEAAQKLVKKEKVTDQEAHVIKQLIAQHMIYLGKGNVPGQEALIKTLTELAANIDHNTLPPKPEPKTKIDLNPMDVGLQAKPEVKPKEEFKPDKGGIFKLPKLKREERGERKRDRRD